MKKRFNKPFFLFVGAFRYYKGLHLALEAIKGTDIKLVLAGDGEVEKELKLQAKSLKIDNVSFLGNVNHEDKKCLLKLCYAFIFPSQLRSEAFGISLLEAAALGKPLISCEIGTGTSYINVNNITGLVVNPGSSFELREAMKFLKENEDIAIKMGRNAKNRSLKLFAARNQALAYNRVYSELLNQ